MEDILRRWVTSNCRFAAPIKPTSNPAVSPAVRPISVKPDEELPVLTTPKSKEHELTQGLQAPIAQVMQKIEGGIQASKEVLALAQDPANYPSFSQAFQESFPGSTPSEVMAQLSRMSIFLKRIRGTASTFDKSDPRRRQEAKRN